MSEASDHQDSPAARRAAVVLLIALAAFACVAAVLLRWGHSLAVDEPFVANTVRRSWPEISAAFRGDNLPLYYVLLRGWTGLFGDTEIALRGLSIAGYAVAVLATGLAGVRLGGLAVGGLAATLMATSVRIGLLHAAVARPYALLSLWAALSLVCVVALVSPRELEKRKRQFYVAALVLVQLFGLFTHPTYVFIVAGTVVASLLISTRYRWDVVLASGAAVAVYLVSWWSVLRATLESQATSWMQRPTFDDLLNGYLLMWGTGRGAMMLGALMVVVLLDPSRTRALLSRPDVRWVVVCAAAVWLLPFAASIWQPVFLAVRTPVMLLPATSLALAIGVGRIGGWRVSAGLGCVLIAGAAASAWAGTWQPDPTPTRASVAEVARRATCEDTLIVPGLAKDGVEYYLRQAAAAPCLRVERFPESLRNLTLRIADPSERGRLDTEAREKVDVIAARPGAVWLFVARRGLGYEVSEMLERHLQPARPCQPPADLRGAYFDQVLYCP